MVSGDTVRLTADWMGFRSGTEGRVRGFSRRDGKALVEVTFETGLTMSVLRELVEVVGNEPEPPDIDKLS